MEVDDIVELPGRGAYLRVRQGKGRKDRLVPLDADFYKRLKSYLGKQRREGRPSCSPVCVAPPRGSTGRPSSRHSTSAWAGRGRPLPCSQIPAHLRVSRDRQRGRPVDVAAGARSHDARDGIEVRALLRGGPVDRVAGAAADCVTFGRSRPLVELGDDRAGAHHLREAHRGRDVDGASAHCGRRRCQ